MKMQAREPRQQVEVFKISGGDGLASKEPLSTGLRFEGASYMISALKPTTRKPTPHPELVAVASGGNKAQLMTDKFEEF